MIFRLSILIVLLFSQVNGKAQSMLRPNFSISFKPTYQGKPFSVDSSYTLPTGERITISQGLFFVHGFGLATPQGNEVQPVGNKDTVFLVDLGKERSKLYFTFPAGMYNEVRFVVGVPRALNHQDPVYQAYPLRLQDSPMFWDWKGGYIFFKLEGTCETVPQKRFHLAIGDDPRATPIRIGDLFALRPLIELKNESVQHLEIEVQLEKLFTSAEGEPYPFSSKGHFVVHQGKAVDELRRNLIQLFRVFVTNGN